MRQPTTVHAPVRAGHDQAALPAGADVGSQAGMLPNLLIIGAAKAGTTSLHAYLDQHPDIGMSKPKELFYFSYEDWRERRAWYERFFRDDTPVRGESCPQYAMHPAFPDVSRRVH